MLDADLARRLLDLAARDAATRRRLAEGCRLFEGYAPEMEKVHLENASDLEDILDETGWPARSRVGAEAAEAAWLVAQHAISRPSFQRRCRTALAAAVATGEAESRHLAHLVDRIRFHEGRPQVYGTILDWDEEGSLSVGPIEDEDSVDERRREVGLAPLAEAVAAVRDAAVAEGECPPKDLAARRREIDAWRKSVGWCTEDPSGDGGC